MCILVILINADLSQQNQVPKDSFFCIKSQISEAHQISINNIVKLGNGHYAITLGGAKHISYINITEGTLAYDIGMLASPPVTKFVNQKNLTARTLFRSSLLYEYGNIIDCSVTSFAFDRLALKKFLSFECYFI